jgi:histidinol dehydrogenase
MKGFPIVEARSRRGAAVIAKIADRAATVLDPKALATAAEIIADVRRRGDKALLAAVARYDRRRVKQVEELRHLALLEPGERLPVGFPEALERAISAVERFHRPQVHPGYRLEAEGVVLEERRVALDRVALYVPGGRAAYPSTVVMSAIPAQLAGVREVVVATPPETLAQSAALRYTLERLGISEVWGFGGAQAIAALAYGTETVRRVDAIVGPGNRFVAAAKSLVSRDVAIDGVAGPSEVVVLADGTAEPALIAADLLAQAEHDPLAAAILVTTDAKLAKRVRTELERQLEGLATAATARASLASFGAALIVDSIDAGADLVDRLAPEHLQLVGAEIEALAVREWKAGAIFVGGSTPEVFGDYLAGPSHVLPTCGTARFASALGVDSFIRRSHLVACSKAAAGRLAAAAVALAEAEGLSAHAAAALRRL